MGLVYMVMASQFESLRNPFIIFLTIPLSAIGVAWMLFLTRTTLSLFSMIGVIVLVGIVINNSIVLIDYINLLRQRGKGILEATKEAARVRFRPVLMTALTTILAMLPLALEIGPGDMGSDGTLGDRRTSRGDLQYTTGDSSTLSDVRGTKREKTSQWQDKGVRHTCISAS